MTDAERTLRLVGHLEKLDSSQYDENPHFAQARRILANPQAHIGALVEAGVLTVWWDQTKPYSERLEHAMYRVVQPHKHDWRVLPLKAGYEIVTLYCFDSECEAERRVPNRLPIEVPE